MNDEHANRILEKEVLRRNKRKCKGLGSGSGDGTHGYVRSDAQVRQA